MRDVVIGGTGLFVPPNTISNDELVESFNAWVARENAAHAEAIAAGEVAALEPSSAPFIEKASGIRNRRVMDRDGVLDVDRMRPHLPARPNDQPAILAEMAVAAAREALAQAGRDPGTVDGVLVACSNMQRPYPALAIEVQDLLGIGTQRGGGFGFDMNVACSSATFGIRTAHDMVASGSAGAVLVVSPEICSGHLDFRDRDSHFIFGDAATAVLVEATGSTRASDPWIIRGCRLKTAFSNAIRNNAGFLDRCETVDPQRHGAGKLFVQEGRRVFREVCPMVADLITGHLADSGITPDGLARLWLHQANLSMNQLIARRVLGRDATDAEAPVILDEFANTSSAGSIIAFHTYRDDLKAGDTGVICSFGAGYSIGSVIVERAAAA